MCAISLTWIASALAATPPALAVASRTLAGHTATPIATRPLAAIRPLAATNALAAARVAPQTPNPLLAPGGTITGASQAVCTPSPCQNPSGYTTFMLANVPNDDGTTSTRSYAVSRPVNLAPAPGNLAPAVLVFYGSGNCGYGQAGSFNQLAAANRFVVVAMEVPCGRDDNWDKKYVNSPTPTTPNDEPYVAAVVAAITQCPATGAAANQCIDPRRIYAAGQSSGGNMVADIICDPQNSTLFRGYLIDSSSMELFNGAPDCPATNQDFFAMLAIGNVSIDAGLYYDTTPNPHLDVTAFADWAAARLGCGGARVDDAIGSPVASTLRYTYDGPCTYALAGSAAVTTLGIQNGGHGFGCQDSDPAAAPNVCTNMPTPPGLDPFGRPLTNGLSVEQVFWSFVAAGVSPATPPASRLQAPTVVLTGPMPGTDVSGSVTVSAQATSSIGVANVRFLLDGTSLGATLQSGAGGTYSVSWNTAAVGDGPHTLQAVATDRVGLTTASAVANIVVANGSVGKGPGTGHRPSWAVLGDGFASGEGDPPYIAGTATSTDRCHRSVYAYPLAGPAAAQTARLAVSFHACTGATVASLEHPSSRNHEAAQLSWLGGTVKAVTLTIGWSDASMPALIRTCARSVRRCTIQFGAGHALRALAGTSRSDARSLYRLFRQAAVAAPHARVLAIGYPLLLPASRRRTCTPAAGGPSFSPAAMRFIDAQIIRLDGVIATAARAASIGYAGAARTAFAGHEACTALPDVNSELYPNATGQAALAQLVVRQL